MNGNTQRSDGDKRTGSEFVWPWFVQAKGFQLQEWCVLGNSSQQSVAQVCSKGRLQQTRAREVVFVGLDVPRCLKLDDGVLARVFEFGVDVGRSEHGRAGLLEPSGQASNDNRKLVNCCWFTCDDWAA
jgi:hypothetical protein